MRKELNKVPSFQENDLKIMKSETDHTAVRSNNDKVGEFVIPKSEIIPIKLRARDQVINK